MSETIIFRLPPLGEGLTEATVVELYCEEGTRLTRNAKLCAIETDKVSMDLESPYDGVLKRWLAKPGEVVRIDGGLAEIEVNQESFHAASPAFRPTTALERNRDYPPRVRRILEEQGLWAGRDQIPREGVALTCADVERYLQEQRDASSETSRISPAQRILASRFSRAQATAVPATVATEVSWSAIDDAIAVRQGGTPVSLAAIVAWAALQAMRAYPRFQCISTQDGGLRQTDSITIAIAVTREPDELGFGVIREAEEWSNFARSVRRAMRSAVSGTEDEVAKASLIVSDLSQYGICDASPVLVPPALALLFVGSPSWRLVPKMGGTYAVHIGKLSLTFDHRYINGVGAARFLQSIRSGVEQFRLPV